MSLLERRMMMKHGGGGVVEPNVLWLDGINNTRSGHSTTTNVWEDLTANHYDFSLRVATSTPIWDKNGYKNVKSPANDMIYSGNITRDLTSFTITVVAKALSVGYGWIFSNRSGSGSTIAGFQILERQSSYAFGTDFYNNNTQDVLPSETEDDVLDEMSTATLTYSNETGEFIRYINGEVDAIEDNISLSSISRSLAQKNFLVGNSWNKAFVFDGYIYSIRIYDKALTQAEIAANWSADLARFSA